ncbi:hypothetical protein PENSPDRAFT_646148 [Peniophora sp. CONT]|nr:hypothetical protein PENSPDRAFT_646148 [Peniophora sp. CONT]
MPSLALRVVWFILTLTAIPASWLVLIPFSMATGVWWAQMLYGIVVTFMEGCFALGMIWLMKPLNMPRAFCLAQAIIPAVGSYLLSGICACLTYGTYAIVANPTKVASNHRQPSSPLAWRHIYIIFIGLWPLLATSTFLAVSLKYDAFQPSDDLHCDVTRPLWPRVFGYAGAPLLVAIPCLGLSVVTARRIIAVSAQASNVRARHQEQDTRLTPRPMTAKERRTSGQPSRGSQRGRPPSLKLHPPSPHDRRAASGLHGLTTLSIPRSAASSFFPPSPGTINTVTSTDATHVTPEISMPPPPPFYHRRTSSSPTPSTRSNPSRTSSASPITFAPTKQTPQRPSTAPEPTSPPYTPSFDPGSFEWMYGFGPRAVTSPISPTSPSRERISVDLGMRGFHLPRRASIDIDNSRRPSVTTLTPSIDHTIEPMPEPYVYPPSGPGSTQRWYPDKVGARLEEQEEEEDENASIETVSYDSPRRHAYSRMDMNESKMEFAIRSEPYMIEAARSPSTFARSSPRRKRSDSSLAMSGLVSGALWHIVALQFVFICTIILAGLTTWVDLAHHPDSPASFGTQHVALVLSGWGPFFVFGHIPVVRNEMLKLMRLR